MKKFVVFIIAFTICGIVNAQTTDEISKLKSGINKYRTKISVLSNNIENAKSNNEREDLMEDIEDELDDLEDFIEESTDCYKRKIVSWNFVSDDLNINRTPTALKIEFDNFKFSASPVTYTYQDGNISWFSTSVKKTIETNDYVCNTTPTTFRFRSKKVENVTDSIETNDTTYVLYRKKSKIAVVQNNNDSICESVNVGGNRFINHDYDNDRMFSWIYFGINNFFNSDGMLDQPEEDFMELNGGRSIEFGFNIVNHKWTLKDWFYIVAALDLKFNHYSFQNTFNLDVDNRIVCANYDNLPVQSFKRHNLRTSYLVLPLILEFKPNPYAIHPVSIQVGVEGGVRIGCREKQIFKLDGDRQVVRNRNDFETNLFSYSSYLGFGYRNIAIYTTMTSITLFKKDHGPELYPFTVGIKFKI